MPTAPNNINRRTSTVLAMCAVMASIFLALHTKKSWPLADKLGDAEDYVRDWFAINGRKTPIDPRLALIGIDRATYDDVLFADEAKSDPVLAALREQFPWSRRVWAAMIERLANAGAKTIVLDLVF